MASRPPGYGRNMTDQQRDPDEEAPDVTSDPARDDEDGGDWTTEGGATEEGPATDTGDD
jgi:hypothetical protein